MRLAQALWTELASDLPTRPRPARPMGVLLSGPPISGKTTLARALAARVPTAVLHIENDRVRPAVAAQLGRARPRFDRLEDQRTYETARCLVAQALARGVSALHDATNLTERARAGVVEVARAWGAPRAVVLVRTPHGIRDQRVRRLPPARRRAFQALGHHRPDPGDCTEPCVLVDGTRPVGELARRLLADPLLAPLSRPHHAAGQRP